MEPYDDAVVLSEQETYGGTKVPKSADIILIEEIEAGIWICEYRIEDPRLAGGFRYDWFRVPSSEIATLKLDIIE